MAQLIPYLSFTGNCLEAMEFYKSIFGGTLEVQTMGESPMASQFPAEAHDQVLHCALQSDVVHMYASDMSDPTMKRGSDISLCIVCDSKEQIETFWAKLSEGGRGDHPLKEEFFGTFGDLTDKYGFRWMLQFGMGGIK